MPVSEPEKKFDWEAAKKCLAEIQQEAPQILEQAVVIGGMACWFYRQLLATANDPDFKVPELSPEQEALWLSKDIDFTNVFIEEARQILKNFIVFDTQGRPRIQVAGVPVGFAQVGITLDPEEAWLDSWIGTFKAGTKVISFRVVEPIALYREKQALSQKRGSASDAPHLSLLAEFLRYETCCQLKSLKEAKTIEDKAVPLKFVASIRDRAIEICRPAVFHRRVKRELAGAVLNSAEQTLIKALAQPSAD